MAQDEQAKGTTYDPNFLFPVRDLENARVKLALFDPAIYANEFFEETKAYPELYKYYPPGNYDSVTDFVEAFVGDMIQKRPGVVLFVILDKTGESPRLAGMIGLLNTSDVDQCTELGYIMVFPAFQRTHISSNAIGLLVHYCLELPAESAKGELKYGPGLGLRRVQWQAHADNAPSIRTAQRMGFRLEGYIRWQRVLDMHKTGPAVPPERLALCARPGRHSVMLSLCWDDWELEGGRETVQKQMDRC